MAYMCNAHAQSDDMPSANLPSNAIIQGVGENLVINGVPTKVILFTSPESNEQFKRSVQNRFQQALTWRVAATGHTLASARVGAHFVSLEIRPSGNATSGRWSASKLFSSNNLPRSPPPPWFPTAAKIIHQVESTDFDKQSQLLVGQTTDPIESTAIGLESSLLRSGFVQSTEVKRTWVAREHYANVLKNSREEVSLSITRDQQMTIIVMNRISALERLQ